MVYQGSERHTGCQFSFTCDGSVARIPSQRAWERACAVAAAALAGVVEPSVGMATHYHTTWVVPYWAGSLTKLTTIGAHIFYRWPGYWGKRAAFTGRYRGEDLLAASPIAAGPPQPVVATDFLSAAVAALSRLRADEHAGEMGRAASAGTSKASRVAALSADQVAGELLVDEKQAVLRNGPAPPPEEPGTAVSGN